jgi:hypothetical protein
MKTPAKCRVKGCARPVFIQSRRLCSAHYARWLKTGETGGAKIQKRRTLPIT